MNHATPPLRNFAIRLMACEQVGQSPSGPKLTAGFYVCEKLHLRLAKFHTGFHALLTRALALAAAEVSWLRAVHIKADGSLVGLEAPQAQQDADELLEGGVVLLAQLLGLMVLFVGEVLTVRLVREVWPRIRIDDLDFGNGGIYESTR